MMLWFCSGISPDTFAAPLEEAGDLESMITEARALIGIGENKKALTRLLSAKAQSKRFGNKKLLYAANIELGNLYTMIGNTLEAGSLLKSLVPSAEYGPELNCRFHHRIAFYYNQTGNSTLAIDHLYKALRIADENDVKDVHGLIYNELGSVYWREGKKDNSIKNYLLARANFDANSFDYANNAFNIGKAYYEMKEYDSTIHYLSPAVSVLDGKKWYRIESPANFYLYLCYLEKGDSLRAFQHLAVNRMAELNLRLEQHDKQFEELQVEYQTKEKNLKIEQQRDMLVKNSEEKRLLVTLIISLAVLFLFSLTFYLIIRKKNKRLSALLEENEFLVGEANHRIKNNLQLISSLIAKELSEIKDTELKSLKKIALEIDSISILHQQLYLEKNKDQINIGNYLGELNLNLKPLLDARNIDMYLDIQSFNTKLDQATYIGLLFSELVINTLKHAFSNGEEEKRIDVSLLSERGSKLIFSYADSGKGLKAGTPEPKLVNLLCRQLKADYELKRGKGFGIKLKVNLKWKR